MMDSDDEKEYTFEIEYITSADVHYNGYPRGNFPFNPGFAFRLFTEEELMSLCRVAKQYCALDGFDSKLIKTESYAIKYPDRRTMKVLTLVCPTIPVVYLRLGKSEKEVKIMLLINKFLSENYTFQLLTVKSLPLLAPPTKYTNIFNRGQENKKLLEHPLSGDMIKDHDRLYICLAAKQHISDLEPDFRVPSMMKSHINVPQYLLFEFPAGVDKQIAIECPSSPTMFIYFGKTYNEVVVVMIQE